MWLINENDVETVVLLGKNVTRSKSHVDLGLDVEDYYRIKDSEKKSNLFNHACGHWEKS